MDEEERWRRRRTTRGGRKGGMGSGEVGWKGKIKVEKCEIEDGKREEE